VTRELGAVVLVLPLLTACPAKEHPPSPVLDPSPSASASTAPLEPRSHWYQGTWTGKYDAKRREVEVAPDAGRLRAWDDDDGTQGTGPGEIEISIDAEGRVTGKGKGALGEMIVSGAVEGESVRLRLLPPAGVSGPAFAGYVVADRKGGDLVGVLAASSGDSLLVRRAEVELEKRRD